MLLTMLYKVKGKKLSTNSLVHLQNGKDGLGEEIPGVRGRHITGQLMGSTEAVEVKDLKYHSIPIWRRGYGLI